jgi:methanethiol S-methyltransferase
MPDSILFLYIVVFVVFFITHSVLASLWFKKWCFDHWPGLELSYRLFFNILSTILLVPLLVLLSLYPGELLWQWTSWKAILMNLLAFTAMIGFYLSLSDYNINDFLGINLSTQKIIKQPTQEKFYLGKFHRYVRHPWYFFLLVILWTRDMTSYQFLSTIMISVYLIIGSYLEEKKLISCFGEVYHLYQTKVSGLIPLPWKYLSKSEADSLLKKQADTK